jgi:membrane protein required for colicin V production
MTSLDWIVLAILGLSTFLGVLRGLARESLSLAAWVLAFVGARQFASFVAPALPGLDSPSLRYAVALVLLFVVILILASLASALVAKLINLAGLGFYDRVLGGFFGIVRGTLALLGLTLVAGLTAVPKTQAWQHALTRIPLEQMASKLHPWLPPDLAALIRY